MTIKVQPSLAQLPLKTLPESNYENLPIDKGKDVAVLNFECYFKKSDSPVDDPTKFKEINFNLDNNPLE